MTDEPLRVAIVDDQAAIRDGFARIVATQADLEVVGLGRTGQEGVDLARVLRPDVVVMDVRMPGMDGIAATRAIVDAAGEATRVLVVTTFNLDEYVYEALQAGASGFLLKDAGPQQLVDGIRTVARGEALIDPAVTRALIGAHATRIRPLSAPGLGVESLTGREREVLRLLARGMSNAEIAAELVVTRETVKTYVSRLLTKLGLRDRVQAVVLAYRAGIADD